MLLRTVRPEVRNCTFLFLVVLLAAIPYEFRLGFYSDDWWYHDALVQSSSQGVPTMYRALLARDPGLRTRPVQVAYLVLGFKMFGQHATGYHLVNSLIFAIVSCLLYLVLMIFEATRDISLSVALLYGVLPHYSTVHFWIACHQAGISLALTLFGIYALSRYLDTSGRRNLWLGASCIAFVMSFFSYEVPVGLIALAIVVLAARECLQRRGAPGYLMRQYWGLFALVLVLLATGILKAKSQTRVVVHSSLPTILLHFMQRSSGLVPVAFRFQFWNYGMRLPVVLFRLWRGAALHWESVLAATLLALVISIYLRAGFNSETKPRLRRVLLYFILGFILFCSGYGLFIMAQDSFSTPGINNRVEIVSALGATLSEVALIELIVCCLRSKKAIRWVRSLALGTVCGLNCLVLYGIAYYWVDAAAKQAVILNEVSANRNAVPGGSVVLLDGFCRYSGPAPVFETDWDTTGALRLAFNDFSLTGDVVSPQLRLSESSVETTIYGAPEGYYPYGDRLFVYNLQQHALVRLTSREAAEEYLAANNPNRSTCPSAREGFGAKIF